VFLTTRQRRYLGLFGLSLVIAIICALAGTWQIARFHEKHDANHELRANNKLQTVDVAQALGPAARPKATGKTAQFRHVSATGVYLASRQTLERGQTVNSNVGYLVITPFQTSAGVLLVNRGFIEQTGKATLTPAAPAPPTGVVSITARMQPADTKADRLGQLSSDQVEAINPILQAQRIGAPVWNGYAELLDSQPGASGLTVIPSPDLSNPAGGAEEPQHAAYVVQWYLFGGLALAMPFVLAAAERRRDETGDPDAHPEPAGPTEKPSRQQHRQSRDDRLAGKA
jgi:cytochrome oxidase assembly protein ShyY1